MKLILIIITLLFSFNAMAEAEIWKCIQHNIDEAAKPEEVFYFNIMVSPNEGKVFMRENGKWYLLLDSTNSSYSYDKFHKSVSFKDKDKNILDNIEWRSKEYIFDLIIKELITVNIENVNTIKEEKTIIKSICEVIN